MARPIDPSAKRNAVACRLDDKQREWLELWRPGGAAADQLADLIERAQTFWPAGPDKFGRDTDPSAPKKERLTPAVSRYAAAQGITRSEALNRAWKAFEDSQAEEKAYQKLLDQSND